MNLNFVNALTSLLLHETLFQPAAVTIRFNAIEYTNNEEEPAVPVIVTKNQRLARPVSLFIEPLTVEKAMMRNISIPLVGDVDITAVNPRIPIRARGKHFIQLINFTLNRELF